MDFPKLSPIELYHPNLTSDRPFRFCLLDFTPCLSNATRHPSMYEQVCALLIWRVEVSFC